MPRPIHFEIPAGDPERAIGFYTTVLGWKIVKWDGPVDYWLISTGDPAEPGINGGLLLRRDPNQPCVNTIGVENLDETLQAVERHGGQCVVPKMPIPGVGWLAYCKDTEGNLFGLMQADSPAVM